MATRKTSKIVTMIIMSNTTTAEQDAYHEGTDVPKYPTPAEAAVEAVVVAVEEAVEIIAEEAAAPTPDHDPLPPAEDAVPVTPPDPIPEPEPDPVPDPVEEPEEPVVVPPPPAEEPAPTPPSNDIDVFPTLDTSGAVWNHTFSQYANNTPYTASMADDDFNFSWQSFSARSSTIKNGRWSIVIPKDIHKKGIHAALDIPDADEYYFGYEIEFTTGYDFSIGGKLPGLVGLNRSLKKDNGNQVYPDGCNRTGQLADEGFSLRSMFRENGKGIGYFYHEDNPNLLPGGNNNCGEEVTYKHNGGTFYFKKGKRYYVETYCKMNTSGNHDGIVRIYVNGHMVVERTNMRFSKSLGYKLNHIMFYIWHGGSTSRWAPSVDSEMFFDNVILSTKPISFHN